MSLTAEQIIKVAEELKHKYELLDGNVDEILAHLNFTDVQLENTLEVSGGCHPVDVWKLHDYLEEKLTEQGKTFEKSTVLKKNNYFPYTKTW